VTTDKMGPGGNKPGPLPFDITKAHQARGYDYLLGGKDNISQEVRADFRNRV
jgi:hypothetical protein